MGKDNDKMSSKPPTRPPAGGKPQGKNPPKPTGKKK